MIRILLFLLVGSSLVLAQTPSLSQENLDFLDLVERKAFDFFLHEHHPTTGLVKDRSNNFSTDTSNISSIAATGFGLTAMVVGAERGWISRDEAREYCGRTLRFALEGLETNHGFFYHFMHWETGKRTKTTELSSIDTALFLAGALTAGQYFKGTEVETLANQLYERVDFSWMLNSGKTLSMGWDPQQEKFLRQRWSDYNESLILYVLAAGSPTYPISSESWKEVNKRIGLYGPHVLIYSAPLFTHQYSHLWLDLRNRNDGFADYFENSRIATLVNRQFCIDQGRRFKTYSEEVWGLTASLGPGGYLPYGSGPGRSLHDGTVAPTAAAGSIVFTPELSIQALRTMYEQYKDRLWGRYGFSDAFNLDRNWFAREVLAIDQGPMVLMIENHRSELIWRVFMQHPAVQRGLERLGFRPGTASLPRPVRPKLVIPQLTRRIVVDGSLEDWEAWDFSVKLESPFHRELGEISGPEDLGGGLALAWDPDFLYVAARIKDESWVARTKASQIWRDDLLELFFDVNGNGFQWKNSKDVQLGFAPAMVGGTERTWVWPANFDPMERGEVSARILRRSDGYEVEAKIAWKLLGIEPHKDLVFGLSPALHDRDEDGSEAKLNWFFVPEGRSGRDLVGEVVLGGEK